MVDKGLNIGEVGFSFTGDTTNASEAVHKLTAEINALTAAVEKAQRALDALHGAPLGADMCGLAAAELALPEAAVVARPRAARVA